VQRHRCFVALDLPPAIWKAAVTSQTALRAVHGDLRFTNPVNLHLTLKFLGEIESPEVEETQNRLHDIVCPPFDVHLGEAGCFRPRIIWLALRGAEALQQQVDAALDGLFEPEHRFMGHITIARTKQIPALLSRTVESIAVPDLTAPVATFSLQESHLSPTGPSYDTLARFEVGRPSGA